MLWFVSLFAFFGMYFLNVDLSRWVQMCGSAHTVCSHFVI